MRVIGYTRVSTNRQLERDGKGLLAQRHEIEKAAGELGYEIVGWYADKALSGASDLEVRGGLAQAMADLRAGAADAVMVYRLDRLSRDLILQEQLLREVWSTGGTIVSCLVSETQLLLDDPSDPSNATRRLIRQVLGAIAEYERQVIRMRLRAGLERKVAAGGFGGGRAPYGWRAIDGELVAEPGEQEVLRVIHSSAGSGMSARRIAELLNEQGVRRPSGALWSHQKVRRAMLHEPEVEVAANV